MRRSLLLIWKFMLLLVLPALVVKNAVSAERISLLPSQQMLYHAPCDRSRKVFTSEYGEISDGPAGFNYTQDSHCEWLIKAKNDSQFITLTFHSMGTECSYDYIYVYDGDGFNSTLLGSFSGSTPPQRLVARSGSMLILMYSDTNYVLDGFRASYFISNCLNNCHNHGKCVGHQCVCHGEWVLPDCEDEACPNKCGESLGRGKCIKGVCHCEKGHSGRLCDLHSNPPGGNWRWLATDAEGMTARAAHTAVYIEEEDSLYVFGGYDLNNVINTLQIYSFKKNHWHDEWGIALQNRRHYYHQQKIDHTLLKAVLQHKNEDEAKLWGLNSDVSIFRNILYTLAESNLHQRRTRSSQLLTTVNVNSTDEELSEYLEDILEEVTDHKPHGRYGHAAAAVPGGFVIFGGKQSNDSFFNDLWFYNRSESGGKWKQFGTQSKIKPPPVARHTLTFAGDYLYLFGGSLETGEFSSDIYRFRWLTTNTEKEMESQWELIHPRGGKKLDVRLAAHTTVYYKATNSLIVFGGIMTSLARFSKLSDRIFAFQLDKLHWTEILYPRTALRDTNIPRERAFHTATVSGNYMIVFGGYTHRHNKDEICYDNQMYWYHLSCHIWINQEVSAEDNLYPKKQGVFAHAAALRRNNTLLVVGGYHGNVNADLFAYELPQVLRANGMFGHNPEMACRYHTSHTACLSNPECGWCSADSSCYGRTIGANCTSNLQTSRCPGICPSLGDCHSCLVHGTQWHKTHEDSESVASKLGLNECTWCVQNAKCHHRDDNYGICGEDSPGWWGSQGTEIRHPSQCTRNDRRPGLTYIKYHYPVNLTMPDFVAIVNATMVDFSSPTPTTQYEQKMEGEMLARLLGFVRPPKKQWEGEPTEIQVCTSYSNAVLLAGLGRDINNLKELTRQSSNQSYCSNVEIPSTEQPFLIDFQARRRIGLNNIYNTYQKTKMELQHIYHGNLNAFTFEYLEPYSSVENCSQYTNCLQCLTNNACGWCSLQNQCMPKSVNETESCTLPVSGSEILWEYLINQHSHCANCSNYVSCEECVGSNTCEWWAEEARCARLGKSENSVRTLEQCPVQCRLRSTCDDCLNAKGRCVWCEARSACFSFAVYTSEYQFGMCREWLDQTVSAHQIEDANVGYTTRTTSAVVPSPLMPIHMTPPKQQCKSCAQYRNCTTCLRTLSCGWCFDRERPIEGLCMQGDFSRPFENCSLALNSSFHHDAEWAYAQCPDVDECGLGLHDCHKEAKCTNTHGSYNCHCRRGFIGDGRSTCLRTCFENCIHGYCSGPPDYICKCELGWTGPDCGINCGCHNHSTCNERVGKCDSCQAWTEGDRCERCRQGSYGNATSAAGCSPCECNGHGNQDLGICNVNNGECFCKDNTIGIKCDSCAAGYYGDPRDGGQCYYRCESRGMLQNIGRSGIGSYKAYKSPWGKLEVKECLWILAPKTLHAEKSLLQVEFEWSSLAMDCDENAVYIYDSLPDLTGVSQQNQLLAVVCNPYTSSHIIEARSSHVTIYYKQGGGQRKHFGFNAIYTVKNCVSNTCLHPHICDEQQRCVCPAGYVGPKCETEVCPKNCNAKRMQGYCDTDYGRCICNQGWGGPDCGSIIKLNQLTVTQLFNTMLLSESYEHLRKTIPRFGHTVCADRRGSLWIFGGYSPVHGPLNDFRQFDTKNGTWMQVTVESTPDDKMPLGRYFHAAEIYLKKQTIFIYGGITITGSTSAPKPEILADFWQFSIQNQRWSELELTSHRIKPPALAGHTLTYTRINERESLILIGGMSLNKSRQLELWEFNLETFRWEQLLALGVRMPVLYGHSTVYHTDKHIMYVFGGYSTEPQGKLYALNLQKMTWTELPSFRDINRADSLLPRARYFHSAVTTDQYMIIYGGRTLPYNNSDVLIAYVYSCNQWIRLTEDVQIIGKLQTSTYAEDISLDHDNNAIYIIGGWDGSAAQSQVTKIVLPFDICQLWSAGKYLCRHYMGCSFCTVSGNFLTSSHCFSHGLGGVCNSGNGTLVYNHGAACDDAWMAKRNCSSFTTCSECLASWPTHLESTSVCQWCDECGIKGRCVPSGVDCERRSSWCSKEVSVGLLNLCPQPQCHTLHCESCMLNENCEWAQNELGTIECITKELVEQNQYRIVEQCPHPCHHYTNCSTCLTNDVTEQPKDCKWSTMLNTCLSPQTQPLLCAGGVCGLVLEENETDHCPERCPMFTSCSLCLEHAHCGWCAREGFNGDGICIEGSLENKQEYPSGSTCDLIYTSLRNDSLLTPADVVSWNYVKCPAENECTNGHHHCSPISQRCIDTPTGYDCVCGEGYRADENDTCIPVCSNGCVRGNCKSPNVCECDFGYVGANCSIQCLCNGHSNCEGPNLLDECIMCHNNTMGAQCEKCQPLFVGDPREGRSCVPCHEYCNGHTDSCIAHDSDPALFNMTRPELEKNLLEGPVANATCLRCANSTAGQRCDTCIVGYFRGTEDHRSECRPCQCHGHGNVCDPVTGEKCNCGNNTESDATCTAGGGKNSAHLCWSVQCSKCRDSYAGNPIDGHQCYKQITVESRMCFDAKPIEECKAKPAALQPGQTVFFVIQPRFMNVDIRIIIDVTLGEVDVYMSPQDDSFIVESNDTTGYHDIFLDNRYNWGPKMKRTHPLNIAQPRSDNSSGSSSGSSGGGGGGAATTTSSFSKLIMTDKRSGSSSTSSFYVPHIQDCKSHGGHSFIVKDQHAKDLSTHVTLNQCNTLLRLFGLKNRLVLTLPQHAHNLSATRFFIALRASSESSFGSVVFRQDQLHIDLFVFFSVFFSCFFLFLAVCVVIWKVKQTADIRRARRQHVVELLHLAKRPFAYVFLAANSFELDSPHPTTSASTATSSNRIMLRSRNHQTNAAGATSHSQLPEVLLISIEPTSDNLAAVGTVFVSLPGRYKAPLSMTLGSTLISYPPRLYQVNNRHYSRPSRGAPPPNANVTGGLSGAAAGVGGGGGGSARRQAAPPPPAALHDDNLPVYNLG